MSDPIALLTAWRDEARAAGVAEPDACALATATPDGVPSVRMVLWRGGDGRALWFFTNYESRKAIELDTNPRAALCFHFAPLERQVRVEGTVERLPATDSDAYFATRPRGSQLGAWASPQSRPIASLEALLEDVEALDRKYRGAPVPRPPFWGGYRLWAERFEFWRARPSRLHERREMRRHGDGWQTVILGP